MVDLDVDVSEAIEAASLAVWNVDATCYTVNGWGCVEIEPVGLGGVRIVLRHRSGVETAFAFTRGG